MDSKSSTNGGGGSGSCSPNSKPAAAFHFLRALSRIRRGGGGASLAGRSRRIRRAAYASMARSAGPGSAWSRALLRRLLFPPRGRRRCRAAARGEGAIAVEDMGCRQWVVLRRLVPGGAALGECELLEEAADYVKWLDTQVAVMKAVVDSVVSSSSS